MICRVRLRILRPTTVISKPIWTSTSSPLEYVYHRTRSGLESPVIYNIITSQVRSQQSKMINWTFFVLCFEVLPSFSFFMLAFDIQMLVFWVTIFDDVRFLSWVILGEARIYKWLPWLSYGSCVPIDDDHIAQTSFGLRCSSLSPLENPDRESESSVSWVSVRPENCCVLISRRFMISSHARVSSEFSAEP